MNNKKSLQSMQKLIDIMAQLRSTEGCSWDRQQTPVSLKKYILEEAYELIEAIDNGDPQEIRDELGDLLLQVVFQAQIFTENNQFGMDEIAESISNKLIRRHPHIFADADHEGHEQRWEEIKQQERSERGQSNRLAQRIPNTLPALKRATKLIKKTSQGGSLETIEQMEQQLEQLKNHITNSNPAAIDLEVQIGKLLFNLCKLSAVNDLEPEEILRKKTTRRIAEIDSE